MTGVLHACELVCILALPNKLPKKTSQALETSSGGEWEIERGGRKRHDAQREAKILLVVINLAFSTSTHFSLFSSGFFAIFVFHAVLLVYLSVQAMHKDLLCSQCTNVFAFMKQETTPRAKMKREKRKKWTEQSVHFSIWTEHTNDREYERKICETNSIRFGFHKY